jgi:hypothetical protein
MRFSLVMIDSIHLLLRSKAYCFFVLFSVSTSTFSQDISKMCSFHNCGTGDSVLTENSKGTPAIGCPTKLLSLYTNFVVTSAALIGKPENDPSGETVLYMEQLRQDAEVSGYKEAMNSCWPLANKQRAKILEYAEKGMVRISPVKGGSPYWTAANHLFRL